MRDLSFELFRKNGVFHDCLVHMCIVRSKSIFYHRCSMKESSSDHHAPRLEVRGFHQRLWACPLHRQVLTCGCRVSILNRIFACLSSKIFNVCVITYPVLLAAFHPLVGNCRSGRISCRREIQRWAPTSLGSLEQNSLFQGLKEGDFSWIKVAAKQLRRYSVSCELNDAMLKACTRIPNTSRLIQIF